MILIDVRTPQEYSSVHADGSENFPLQQMMNGVFPNHPKNSEIVLYCRSGGRSEVAKSLMRKAGFTNVTNGGGLGDVSQDLL